LQTAWKLQSQGAEDNSMRRILLVGLAGMLGAVRVPAQDDAPGRGVARLSLSNGDLSVKRGDSGDLVAAAINAPLLAGDRVFSGAASRGEIQFDWANFLRLGPRSEVRLADLENQRYLIQVAEGATLFRVLRDSDAQVELSTPTVSVRPLRRGSYRVEVLPDGTTAVTVRDGGRAEIYTPRGSEVIRDGQTLRARGTAADPEFQVAGAPGEDEFDRWNNNRDRDLNRSQSYRYVPRGVYGVDDLDLYGTWYNDPGYGWVWAPRVAAGWAPYRYGRWSWIDYYGWSWISYDPWGWAPFHYGRWFHGPRGWCWWPGAIGVRTWWRPGLVAFFGFGGGGFGFSAGIGVGGWNNWGWVPLAPFEPFYPWYGGGFYRGFNNRTVINNTTIVNNTNVYNIYRNARIQNAITAVDASQFGRGRGGWSAQGGEYRQVTRGELERANLVRGQLPVAPGRDALRFGDRDVTPGGFPRSREDTRFFSRSQPASVERVPFERQQEALRALEGGRGAGTGRVAESPGGGGGRRPDPAGAGRGDPGGGWNRPGGADGPRTGSGEWSRFGESRGGGAAARGEAGGSMREPAPGAAPPDNGFRRSETPGRGAGSGDSGWRRLGEGRSPGEGRRFGEPNTLPGRDAEVRGSGEWRRFGEANPGSVSRGEIGGAGRGPAAAPAVPPDGGSRRGESQGRGDGFNQRFENDWRRFDGGARGGSAASGGFEPRTEMRGFGGGAAGGFGRGGSAPEPVRINPPIVRDRGGFDRGDAPRVGIPRGNWGGAGGGGRVEAPRGGGGGDASRGSMGPGAGRGGDTGRSGGGGGRRGQ
jgi:hypothetical protein